MTAKPNDVAVNPIIPGLSRGACCQVRIEIVRNEGRSALMAKRNRSDRLNIEALDTFRNSRLRSINPVVAATAQGF